MASIAPAALRELRTALAAFDRAKEWEWSDLFKWLELVKSIIESFPNFDFEDPEKYLLYKRLAQCLNPNLPPGLHYNTLRIYESMLIKIFSTEQSMSDNIPMISAGIFPFFEYASPQTKPLVIDLIQTYYLKLGPQLTLCLSGMVSSLLTGLEDLTNIDVSNKLFKLLDDIAAMGQKPLFTAIWQALLKTPRAKIGALAFLNKRLQKLDKKESDLIPSKELVVNALIAGLRDTEVLIKRPTLDVIKSFFPLNCPILTNTYQSRLMSEVLELLAAKDFTINRRVWEWLGLHDTSTDIVAVVDNMTSALIGFFDRQQASEKEAAVPIGIIESLLDQPELTDILLEAFTSHILEYVNRFRDYQDKYGILMERLKSLLNTHCEKLDIVWGHLTSKLEDQMNTFDMDKTLNAIELMLALKLDTPQDEYLLPVLDNLLGSMEDCNKKDRVKAQKLVLKVLPELSPDRDIKKYAMSYEAFLANMLQEIAEQEEQVSDDLPPASDLSLSLEVYMQLQQYLHFESQMEWIRLLLKVVSSNNIDCALAASLYVLLFVTNSSPMFEAFQSETDGELTRIMVSRLWELCEGPFQLQSAELIIKYFEVYQTAVGDMIREWLTTSDVEKLGGHLKRFTVTWKVAQRVSKVDKDYVMMFFGQGVGVHEAICALEHSSPRIRHLGKEWLMNSLTRLDVVIHSVLPLSPLPKEEAITRKAIQQLRVMIENGGEMFINKLRSEVIWQPLEYIEKGPGRLKPSYFNTLLFQIVLKVFMKEGQDGVPIHDSSPLQFDACTVVKQLLNWGDPEAATELSPYLLWKLVRVVERKDLVLQYQLIEVMQIIIFKSKLKAEQLKSVIDSPDFLKVIVLGLNADSQSALAFWMRLLPDFLRLSISLLDAENSCRLFADLMTKLGSVMQDYRDLTIIDTYVSLLHIALEIYSPSTFTKHKPFGSYFAGTFPELANLNRHPNISSLLTTLAAGVESSGMHRTYKILISVFKEAREMLAKWPASTPAFPVKCSEAPSPYEPVIRALEPLAREFPTELTAICAKAWLALFDNPDIPNDAEKWKILQIYLDLKLRGEKILSSIEKFLREGLNLKKSSRKNTDSKVEIRICDLLNSLFFSHCFSAVDSVEAWIIILRICEVLNNSQSSECPLWTAELLVFAQRAVSFEPCYIDKKLVKEVQQRVQHLIQHIISLCTSRSTGSLSISPPSANAVVLKETNLHICALLTLKSTLVDLVRLGWNSEYEQVAQLRTLTTPLLLSILEERSTLQDDMATDLVAELINSCSPEFAQYIKRDIIDFFVTEEFWNKLRCAKFDFIHWRKLLGLLVKKCFEDRLTIVQEILKKLNVGFFTSKSSEIQQRSRILRCLSLLIYSGERDEYQHVIDDLAKKIIEELKVHEGALIPLIFLLCRVLIVKLEPPTLAEIWPRLWPHLFVDLVRIFSEEVAPMHQLSAMKLLELLYLTGNEDFQFASWVFFGTTSAGKGDLDFIPCVEKLFKLASNEDVDLSEVRDFVKKPLEVTLTAAESTEELQDSVQRLLSAVIQDSSTAIVADWDSVNQVLESDILNLEVI